MATVFEVLFNSNVNDHTEEVKSEYGKNLTYLSWAWAWAEIKKRYPEAKYEIVKFDGIPFKEQGNESRALYLYH